MTARAGWWRENRLWLASLPLALAAVTASSSYDLDFWWDNGLHHELGSAPQGGTARVTDDYDDALGETSRTFEVELAELRTTELYPYAFEEPAPPPDGVQAVAVHLRWRAEPDQVLRGCKVALVDDEGRRYEADSSDSPVACVPEERGGPEDPHGDVGRGVVPDGEADRPPTWTTAPVVLVPDGRTITRVLVWWERPDYVSLSVS
ncbi:hypothetical protein [Nocardioides halotolerans]|uniref:hypothetical protein n=1 Tax=Nocardioides halotolerans TaxID=433660 RepID=UPI00048D2FA3|nr:hypothetical protein [Nocardioides halotolerans]